MAPSFGTDGVRAPAAELTDDFVAALGRAAGRVLAAELRHRPDRRFLVARDPRESGPRIEAALVRGLAAEQVACELLGVAPTPALAWVAAARDVPAAMISASHNAYGDNGIKLFAPGGRKLGDDLEAELEAVLAEVMTLPPPGPVPADLGPAVGGEDVARYELAVVNALEGRTLEGMHIVVDCANGAASEVAPRVLTRLGAAVEVLHADPDGRNINAGCGSTHPDDLQREVPARGADLGLAFDGDADRVLAVDEHGALVDGDQLLAMCALDLRARGRLRHDAVVVTVMSNLGFRLAMREAGIEVVETPVGDRHVLEALAAGGYALGGEQSGHIVFPGLATTGDGVLTGAVVCDLVRRDGRPVSEVVAAAMTRMPQVLRNVVVERPGREVVEAIAAPLAAATSRLGDRGRVLVRPSGTEPLVRVMVEADDEAVAAEVAETLVQAVTEAARA